MGNLERLCTPPASAGFTGVLLDWFDEVSRAYSPFQTLLALRSFELKAGTALGLCL